MNKVMCYVGAEVKGNPGPAAIGVYIADESTTEVFESKQVIGNATLQFAVYNAVMLGLQNLLQIYGSATQLTRFEICLSHEAVKKQLNAEVPVTEPGLVPMFIEIHNLRVAHFPYLTFTEVPETQNQETKRLAGEVLDGQ
jgi:hypothetical protein